MQNDTRMKMQVYINVVEKECKDVQSKNSMFC